MEWQDEGIIVGVRPHGESSQIISIFMETQGLRTGLYKPSRRSRGQIQLGTCVKARWWGRLPTHLGQWALDPLWSLAHHLFAMPLSLEALSAATALLVPTLPPHESHPLLYKGFCQFLQRLKESTSSQESLLAYVIFELLFLEGSGFGLDLKKCAVTEREDDLIYVSPRSGRAVCGEAGLPYAHKLLKLPPFINELKTGSPLSQFSSGLTFTDLKQALELTGYFIESHVFQPISTPIPASRDRLFQEVRKKIKK